MIKKKTKMIAAPQYQQWENSGKPHGSFAINLIHQEETRQTSHRATHSKGAENQRPKYLVAHVAPSGEEKYSYSEEYDFGKKRADVE